MTMTTLASAERVALLVRERVHNAVDALFRA
jgi:hypothetical protein